MRRVQGDREPRGGGHAVSFYRAQNNSEKSLHALEKVMELTGGGSDQLRFSQADVLVDLGELDRAEEVAKSLNEPIYGKLIRGRILLARGDPAGALDSFEQGIRRWPNNAGARYLAGLAAYEMHDYDRAISELREAARAEMGATEAAIVLARIYFERAEYQQAATFASAYVKKQDRAQRAEAFILGARALQRIGEYEKARAALSELLETPEKRGAAVAELANIARAESGTEASIATIREADLDLTDPRNQPALRVIAEDLTNEGRSDEALTLARAAVAANPDVGWVHEILGAVMVRAEREEEATAAYLKALEIDPENAAAVGGLATLKAQSGDLAGAVGKFDRAAELAPDEPAYAYSAAQLTLASGQVDDAIGRLREIVKRAPGHASSRNDLAWLLADRGEDLDLALSLAQKARRIDPSPDVLDTLGWVHLKRGESSAAVEVLEEAVIARADSPSIRYRLATALQQSGDSERAAQMLRLALESGTFPEAEEARRQLTKLEQP